MALANRFYFDTCTVDILGGRIIYTYSTDAGHSFTHVLTHTFPPGTQADQLIPAAFALGMAELVHYWKTILAPEIVIKTGKLSQEQIIFWENLYTRGLGEFFYKNQIDFRGLVFVTSDPEAPEILPSNNARKEFRTLVPFGGGKDSLVTGELLNRQNKEFTWFELEPLPVSEKLKALSPTTKSLCMGRNVKDNFAPILELVQAGAPNGHVPISATYMFGAALIAEAHGFTDIVMSLERSANEGNLEYLGMLVNHPYSKSFEFEQMIHAYVQQYINPELRLFSLLRPLYEIQVVQRFVQYPKYFPHFISCNRGLQTGAWCGECAKCAFVFAALSAFLSPTEVETIFKKNLFTNEKLIPLFEALIGLEADKPFDCVGTLEENLLILYLSGEKYKELGLPLPPVLAQLPIERGAEYVPLLTAVNTEHLIPADYKIV